MDTEEVTLGSPEADARMLADWKEISAKHSDVEDEPEVESVEKPEPAAEEETKDRPRDEKGKFAKQDKQEPEKPVKAPEPAAIAETPAVATPEAAPEAVETNRDINRAPSSWKPAAKAAWANLPPEIRAEIHRREGDFMSGQAGLLPDAQLGKSMRQVIEPYRMLIEAEGGTPERAVNDLLRTAALFRTGSAQQKQAALVQIAQQYGIPMPQAQIGAEGQAPQIPAQDFRDPRLDGLIARMEAQARAQEQDVASRRQQTISAWENEVDAKGQPVRPFVSNVIDEMVSMIPQLRARNPGANEAEILSKAYESACWANPEIRSILEKQKQDELEAKRREETLRKSAEAKKAASVNVPRRAATVAQAAKGSMDETIRDTARNLGILT